MGTTGSGGWPCTCGGRERRAGRPPRQERGSNEGSPMRVDETYLSSLRRREDTELGISEEFVPLVLNGASTFGVVTRPLGRAHPVAWVLCHSFGIEQIHLWRLDVIAARALSAAGFTTLRYHGHGYGDSQGDMRDITLTSHLKDAVTAVGVAARQDGVERVGV